MAISASTWVAMPLLLCAATAADAQSRLLRQYAQESGVIPPVWAIGQDQLGFLWVGAQGGLFRYDGRELEPIQLGEDRSAVISLAFDERGRLAALTERGTLFEVTSGTARELRPPGEPGPRRLHMIAYDGSGALWTVRGSELLRRGGDGAWRSVPASTVGFERPVMVRSDERGGVLVATAAGVWRVAGERWQKLIEAEGIADVAPAGEQVLVLDGYGRLRESHHGLAAIEIDLRKVAPQVQGARPVAVVRRGSTTWIAFDRFLLALRKDRPAELLGAADGIQSGGPLFVDREASLWMGTYSALAQFPEPETRVVSEHHGIPSRHVRFIGRTESNLWLTTWQGAAKIDVATGTSAAARPDWFSQERLCTHPTRRTLWTSSAGRYLELREEADVRLRRGAGRVLGCAPARGGGLWLASSAGLHHVPASGGAPVRTGTPDPQPAGGWEAVFEDATGTLFVAAEGRICQRTAAQERWDCQALGATGKITSIIDVGEGHLWASTMQAGILARSSSGAWEPLAAAGELPTSSVFGLTASPSGGIWIIGHGVVQRVEPRAASWRVLERLGPWNGLPILGGADLVEDADGTIWLASSAGLIQVPPDARFAGAEPPPVALVDALVDGRRLDANELLALPYHRNSLELRFAALSFRDPGMLQYQIRTSPAEPWRGARGSSSFRWSDLRPGSYDVQFRASLDGHRWSVLPAAVGFRIRPPWYRQPWVMILGLFAAGGMALAIHRWRVRMLLGLERQRTQIAMDLHDAIGSGLGSIGIMAGVLASSSDRSGASVQGGGRDLAGEIAATSEQLGSALSDIVWALDPEAAGLQELAARLAEHGDRLCSSRNGGEFVSDFPAVWPDAPLPLRLRRNVVAIGLEALHNAARHSGGERVVLGLCRVGADWELRVEDNGTGIAAAPDREGSRNGGRGLPGMERRAREIGAALEVDTQEGRGTTVRLRFPLS